ncbi:DUF2971 domain-containing protein [Agrobacterium vitis]|uniref:DUF2971 domain-containing protein n=1 Tax=Agrobacterium vitis TaxID=373 RepID=A0AAE2RFC5_AGRVI|nr:DUF2971 domain-containing protein [Agrobacterium vitis]MBF2717505.1 DUF2971 domain-containing protein [Agrobacterium vitis]
MNNSSKTTGTKSKSTSPRQNSFFDSFSIETIRRFSVPTPEKLYHYTSSEGLISITKHHSLRFSDVRFLNDASEFQYGVKIANHVLNNQKKPSLKHSDEVIEKIINNLREASFHFTPIIFCMSATDNLLNQWRDYGKDVVPYSIEFHVPEILKLGAYNFPFLLCNIEYDEEIQHSMMMDVIDRLSQKAVEIIEKDHLDEAQLEELYRAYAVELLIIASRLKHPSFSAENEWRMICFKKNIDELGVKREYRSSALGAIPYYTWGRKDNGKLPITNVTIGPSVYPIISEIALKGLLQDHGYSPNTKYSIIPIRR